MDAMKSACGEYECPCHDKLKDALLHVELSKAAGDAAMAELLKVQKECVAAVLQIEVYRAAYRARYAVQNHDTYCLHCQGSVRCGAGLTLRSAASKAEEQAGELDSDVAEKKLEPCTCSSYSGIETCPTHGPKSEKQI